LFEVNAWTGFLDAFVHLGDGTTRMKDLPTSMVALLVSEACNIGLAPRLKPKYFGNGAAFTVRTGTNRRPSTEASSPSPQNCTIGISAWAAISAAFAAAMVSARS